MSVVDTNLELRDDVYKNHVISLALRHLREIED